MRGCKILVSLLTLSFSDAAVINHRGFQRRDLQTVQEDVTVVKEVQVIKHQDGSLVTGTPVIVNIVHGTSTPAPVAPINEQLSPQGNNQPPPPQNSPQPPPPQINSQPQIIPSPKTFEQVPDSLSNQKTNEEESLSQDPPNTEISQESPKDEQNSLEPSNVDPIAQDSSKAESPNESNTPLKNEVQSKLSHSGKRGIAYNDPTKLNAFTSSSQVSWAYNWGHTATKIPGNMEFVPMLWGSGSHATGWHEAANKALEQGCKHFLAFNEPDLGEQSSLTVGQAVEGYKTHMQPYAGRAKLGSPAVTNGGTPMGLAYLTEFIAQCAGCTIDFVAIHWYNGGTANDFKNHVLKAHLCSGRPVWVTEFQGPGDAAQQQAFLREVIPWLDRQIYVERYAYFMASDGNLISSGTTLSPVGQAFAFTN